MKRNPAAQPGFSESLRALLGKAEFQDGSVEPQWENWVAPLRLPPHAAEELVGSLRRCWLLPFADKAALADLLIFRHTKLPQVARRAEADAAGKCLRRCRLFELLVDMALQGNSVFPQNPTHLAQQVQRLLETPIPLDPALDVLMELVTSPDGHGYRPGFNFVQVTNLRPILAYEHRRRNGSPEWCWKATHKYDLFATEVRQAAEFHQDWRLLSGAFKLERYRDAQGIIRRSPLVEGNWRKPVFSDLANEDCRFRVAFDFFCWKWFLYGMEGDEPMVQKLAVTLTPYGTQIFIPGFWSLDPARDINWAKVTRLHRARGISKQGEKASANEKARARLIQAIQAANADAREQGLKGNARYDYIKRMAGLAAATDDAEIRRYVREPRREMSLKRQDG